MKRRTWRSWAPEERKAASNLRRSGKTLEQIGLALNRSPSSVYSCLKFVRRAKAVERADKTRPCLCCRKPFTSAGAHNRLCPQCANRSISPYAL